MVKLTKKQETILLAIKYITSMKENGYRIYTKSRTITSFLRGTTRSPFYNTFKRYPDVCGKYASITEAEVVEQLKKLVKNDIIKQNNDLYFIPIIIKKVDDDSSDEINIIKNFVIKEKLEQKSSLFECTELEKKYINEALDFALSIGESVVKKENKSYYYIQYTNLRGDKINVIRVRRNKDSGKLFISIKKRKRKNAEEILYELTPSNFDKIKVEIGKLFSVRITFVYEK